MTLPQPQVCRTDAGGDVGQDRHSHSEPTAEDLAREAHIKQCGWSMRLAFDRWERHGNFADHGEGSYWERKMQEAIAARARKSDPATSHEAARKAERFASSHAGRIVSALQLNGPRTAQELSKLTGLTVVQIDRRTIELQRAGRIDVAYLPHGGLHVIDGFRVWRAV